MPNTTNYSLPYPAPTDTPDVPFYMQQLADSVDAELAVHGPTLDAVDTSWTAYTPTLTNATLGNGILTGSYLLMGKTLFLRGKFVLGSTSSLASGSFGASLPSGVTFADSDVATALAGAAHAFDTSAGTRFYRFPRVISASSFNLVDGSNNAINGSTFAWATGDVIDWSFMCEVA